MYKASKVPLLNQWMIERRLAPFIWVPVDSTVYKTAESAEQRVSELVNKSQEEKSV